MTLITEKYIEIIRAGLLGRYLWQTLSVPSSPHWLHCPEMQSIVVPMPHNGSFTAFSPRSSPMLSSEITLKGTPISLALNLPINEGRGEGKKSVST